VQAFTCLSRQNWKKKKKKKNSGLTEELSNCQPVTAWFVAADAISMAATAGQGTIVHWCSVSKQSEDEWTGRGE
jgi:hypothetical protein